MEEDTFSSGTCKADRILYIDRPPEVLHCHGDYFYDEKLRLGRVLHINVHQDMFVTFSQLQIHSDKVPIDNLVLCALPGFFLVF